jgi:hypothetical protein
MKQWPMLPKQRSTTRSIAKWLLIVVVAILALIALVFAFEFLRLLVDPGHRA